VSVRNLFVLKFSIELKHWRDLWPRAESLKESVFPSTSLRSSEGKSFSFSFPLSTYTQTLMAGDVQALSWQNIFLLMIIFYN
jgi:hypothetical protein